MKRKSEPDRGKKPKGPHEIRVPGFVADEAIGLGDVIKRVTSTFGIRPCGGCERRAALLNRWFVFTSRGRSR